MIDEDFEEIMKEQNQYIEELEERLKAATDDAKEAEAYAGELEAVLESIKAKLAKAVDALGEAIYLLDPDEEDIAKETGLYRIVTTYAELTSSEAANGEAKGGKDE